MENRTPAFRNSFSEGMPLLTTSRENSLRYTTSNSPVKPLQIHQPGQNAKRKLQLGFDNNHQESQLHSGKENDSQYEKPTHYSEYHFNRTINQSTHRSPSPKHFDQLYFQLKRRQKSQKLVDLLEQLESLKFPSTSLDPQILTKAETFLLVDKLNTGSYFKLIQLLFVMINHAQNMSKALKIYDMKQKLILQGIHTNIMNDEIEFVNETQPTTPVITNSKGNSLENFVGGQMSSTDPSAKLTDLFDLMSLKEPEFSQSSASSDFSATDYGS